MKHTDIDDHEWNEILEKTSNALHISVEDLLEKIECKQSYDNFMENCAEEQ